MVDGLAEVDEVTFGDEQVLVDFDKGALGEGGAGSGCVHGLAMIEY